MGRTEKTVFISYRRTNLPWALAIYQNLTHRGYDVFFDYESLNSGDFEKIIIGNIRARAHFIVILTPTALERCASPDDWLRREIETALDEKRNIVPLFLEGFNFGNPSIAQCLTGKMAALKNYNGLNVPVDYFEEAMEKLCQRFLNVSLDAVLHPLSSAIEKAVKVQKAVVDKALKAQETATDQAVEVPKAAATKAVKKPKVAVIDDAKAKTSAPTAPDWLKKGNQAKNPNEKIRCFTEAIRLKPNYAEAYLERARAHSKKGNMDEEFKDLTEATRLKPDYAEAYLYIGIMMSYAKKDQEAAIKNFSEAIRSRPNYASAYLYRGQARSYMGDWEGAIKDYSEVIRLNPDDLFAYYYRGRAYEAKGDLDGALKGYTEAIRRNPRDYNAFKSRAMIYEKKKEYAVALADYQKYLKLGGGKRNGDQTKVEESICDLQQKIK